MSDVELKAKQQEIFDISAKHLLTQNARSNDLSGKGCYYRGVNGLMCAIGCFIPDDKYHISMEGTVEYLIQMVEKGRFDLDKTVFNSYNEELMYDLQKVHDSVRDTTQWPSKLKTVAERYKLEYKFD